MLKYSVQKKKPKIFTFFIFGPDTSVTKLYLYISSQKFGKTQDPIKHENMKTILQSFHKLNFKITTKFFDNFMMPYMLKSHCIDKIVFLYFILAFGGFLFLVSFHSEYRSTKTDRLNNFWVAPKATPK